MRSRLEDRLVAIAATLRQYELVGDPNHDQVMLLCLKCRSTTKEVVAGVISVYTAGVTIMDVLERVDQHQGRAHPRGV